ncbi:hypothetical protein PIB30_085772 [Stylosanthes scabra]|uniref:Uncharacterized protein n=1 Tax=Stylosanthes scabra TaxID=79078 RepID=A0ABU6RSU0_9FABA|nr:hypothetical protein [Stylosanthes scabra]
MHIAKHRVCEPAVPWTRLYWAVIHHFGISPLTHDYQPSATMLRSPTMGAPFVTFLTEMAKGGILYVDHPIFGNSLRWHVCGLWDLVIDSNYSVYFNRSFDILICALRIVKFRDCHRVGSSGYPSAVVRECLGVGKCSLVVSLDTVSGQSFGPDTIAVAVVGL